MVPRLLSALAGLVALAACDGLAPPKSRSAVEYRPELAGTVDHAMCLLGFTATPLERLVTGHQLVEGTLNGKPATFILDTGANLSMVHSAHAERFGLEAQPGGFAAAAGLGGMLQASRAPIESLRIGGLDVRRRHLMLADLAQVEGVLGRLSPGPIHGIIGQDVMRTHRMVIDVARPMLYLREAGSRPAPTPADRCVGRSVEAADA